MKKLGVIFAFTLLLISPIFAQTTGTLTGTVNGPDGVIPNAQISIKDNLTGREINVQSNTDGSFTVPKLEAGNYTVNISVSGFKTYTANNLKIDAGRSYSLNPTLEIGVVQETVTIQAGTDLVNSTDAELSSTVSPKQIVDLPLNGRNPLSLISLQAGANPTSFSINGQRTGFTNFTRDGINVQDQFIRTGGFVQDLPTVDDTGEFTIITQNANAALGGGGSSQVQLVTPRGGKGFHGALFEFNRNSAFSANTFFNNSSVDPFGNSVERPFLNRNQFGGKIGGPLPIPNFGKDPGAILKDRGFFFISYEKFLLHQQAPTSPPRTVLLAPARNGTFSYTALADDAANGITAGQRVTVNVLTGQGLNLSTPANQAAFTTAGGVLGVDPLVQSRLLNKIPTVGNLGVTNSGLTQQLLFNLRDNRVRDSLVSRFDFKINDRNDFNFTYRYVNDVDDRGDFDLGGFDTVPFMDTTGVVQLFTGAYRTIIGSNISNEFRVGLTKANPFFNQNGERGSFLIAGATLPLDISNPEATTDPQGRNTRQITVRDDAVWTIGNHSLSFGAQTEQQKIVSTSSFNAIPTFAFATIDDTRTPRLASGLFPGGISATERERADTLRYFLGGIIGSGTVQASPTSSTSGPVIGAPFIEDFRYSLNSFYVSDQWRVKSNLSINFGVRYDVFTSLKNPQGVYLEPVVPQGVNFRDALLNPVGTIDYVGTSLGEIGKIFNTDKDNFAPNVSIAYTPHFDKGWLGSLFGNGKTTLRGGYRISYVNDEYLKSALNAVRGNDGLSVTVNAVDNLPGGGTSIDLNRRLSSLSPTGFPTPNFLTPPFTFEEANLQNGAFFNTLFAVDPNIQVQQNHEFTFGIQRELGFQSVLEIRYVGGWSNNLIRGIDINQIDIRSNGFLDDFNRARRNLILSGEVSGEYNPAIPGSQPTPIFDKLPFGAFLDDPAVTSPLLEGRPIDLAQIYINFGLDFDPTTGQGVAFRRNFNAGGVDLLVNGGKYSYNALQIEYRRRFAQGFSFQANYTFQKTLTDATEDDQTRFDPYLDQNNPQLDYGRPDYDRTHTFNFNSIYELPFGKGKKFFNRGGWTDKIIGGFQLSTIISLSSGAPISIRDPRATLNRSGTRSSRQNANSSLSQDEIKRLTGIYRTPDGVFFIDPRYIAPDGSATNGNLGTTPTSAFANQIFFNAQPGQAGNLSVGFINGPKYINVDMGLSKRITFNERLSLQLRAEAFNLFNRANFFAPGPIGDNTFGENSNIFDVNSTSFGRITDTYDPRILQFGIRFEF